MAVTKVTPAGLSLTRPGKNLLYNSDFAVAQRGTSFSGLGTTAQYTLDGLVYNSVVGTETGRLTLSQDSTVPAGTGHRQSVKIDITTADSSIAAGHGYYLEVRAEAQDVSHLQYGSATAKSLCISFWTRSSTTGNYQFMLEAPDGSRAYSTTYNIASADTWEKKKIVIAGDSSVTINNDTGQGLIYRFSLTMGSNFQGGTQNAWAATANNMYAAGSTLNLFSSTDNDWYIAGLHVEEGDEITDFPFEDYSTTLAKCQRYAFALVGTTNVSAMGAGVARSTTNISASIRFPVVMRSSPTASGTAGSLTIVDGDSTQTVTSFGANASTYGDETSANVSSGLTQGNGVILRNNVNGHIFLYSSEI